MTKFPFCSKLATHFKISKSKRVHTKRAPRGGILRRRKKVQRPFYKPSSLELCAGGGGQALGLEDAGFEHQELVEVDFHACNTLRLNRPHWRVFEEDLNSFDARPYKGIDLVAGGLPCPPFSVAGKQLGQDDERNLFPAALRIIDEARPKAVLIENVRGLLEPRFVEYRAFINRELERLGYVANWRLLNASDFGVPQLRPRVALVALRSEIANLFRWPDVTVKSMNVGDAIYDLMAKHGWRRAAIWRNIANGLAPTIVGGSKKHGGPDLGPTRARKAWEALGVDGLGIADEPPNATFEGMPRLTVRMVARLQGFPDNWGVWGRKTAAYRQVGNAFPPPVAKALASELISCLGARRNSRACA